MADWNCDVCGLTPVTWYPRNDSTGGPFGLGVPDLGDR